MMRCVMIKNKSAFYTLSFTFGIVMTLIGCLAAVGLLIIGIKPKKWGHCYYFEVGDNWGGVNFGFIFIVSKNSSEHTKNHEHGHGHQNCMYGPFMIIISLMSVARYWYREIRYHKNGLIPPTEYDAVWYEGEATKIGTEFMNWYNTQQND